MSPPVRTSEELRAHNRARLLRAVHDTGAALTRAQLTDRLGMARGTASVLVAELSDAGLITESPAEPPSRGRPSHVPGPHAEGPVALTIHLREDGWQLATGTIGGELSVLEEETHQGEPSRVFPEIADRIAAHRERLGHRLVGAAVSVAGPVVNGNLLHVTHLRWEELDVSGWLGTAGIPVRIANDATLAALAEARRGKLRGLSTALHIHVDFGVGGCLMDEGRPLTGARGIAGEYGHMRLTGSTRPCDCGAEGCWGGEVGAVPMLRRYGVAADYRQGRAALARLLRNAADGEPEAVAVLDATADSLGRGIGGLVNAHDPAAVTLSGIGVDLLHRARDTVTAGYRAALMRYHLDDPPPVLPADLGVRGPLVGAMELVFDEFITPERLTAWHQHHAAGDPTGDPRQ
ncbi:ROK family transcriptional regulator [Stackebrandtia albiflava]|nr:ROK family transcriptional regulator [Stackebrandtia albiflava]